MACTSLKIAHYDLTGRPAIILVAFRVDNTMAYVKSEKVTVDIEFSCFFRENSETRHEKARHES